MSNVKQYRKKPVVIEALLWTGSNFDEMDGFLKGEHGFSDTNGHDGKVMIATLEGVMEGNAGDYIIKGVKGEFYPCKPDIFKVTYELVTAPTNDTESMGGGAE